jgi:hypothetical protein
MSKDFLPPDYSVPKKGGGYMKFQDGPNKVRFLSAPILGYEYWNNDNKPVRAREAWESIPADARLDDGFVQAEALLGARRLELRLEGCRDIADNADFDTDADYRPHHQR